MTLARPRIPIRLLVAIVVCFVLGLAARPFIAARTTPAQLADNVLLNAIPFILIFVAILLIFITVIVMVARALNHQIPGRVYQPVERVIIAGILLGIVFIFQPWSFFLYQRGFMVLLVSTLAFILWSHVIPRGTRHLEDGGSLSISEYEQSEAGD